MKFKTLSAIFASVFYVACSRGETRPLDVRTHTSPSDSADAERASGKRCASLAGGAATAAYPSTGIVVYKIGSTSYSSCSGTFIGPNVLMTAGHCVNPSDLLGIRFVGASTLNNVNFNARFAAGSAPVKVIHNGASYIGMGMDFTSEAIRSRDLAFLIFGKTVAPAVSAMAPARPAVGTGVTLVGYGSQVFDSLAPISSIFQQVGRNVVKDLSQGGSNMLAVSGNIASVNVNDTLAAHGDSGGPLFIDSKVAGVLSVGGKLTPTVGFNLWVDLNSATSKALIKSAVAAGAIVGGLTPVVAVVPPVAAPAVVVPVVQPASTSALMVGPKVASELDQVDLSDAADDDAAMSGDGLEITPPSSASPIVDDGRVEVGGGGEGC